MHFYRLLLLALVGLYAVEMSADWNWGWNWYEGSEIAIISEEEIADVENPGGGDEWDGCVVCEFTVLFARVVGHEVDVNGNDRVLLGMFSETYSDPGGFGYDFSETPDFVIQIGLEEVDELVNRLYWTEAEYASYGGTPPEGFSWNYLKPTPLGKYGLVWLDVGEWSLPDPEEYGWIRDDFNLSGITLEYGRSWRVDPITVDPGYDLSWYLLSDNPDYVHRDGDMLRFSFFSRRDIIPIRLLIVGKYGLRAEVVTRDVYVEHDEYPQYPEPPFYAAGWFSIQGFVTDFYDDFENVPSFWVQVQDYGQAYFFTGSGGSNGVYTIEGWYLVWWADYGMRAWMPFENGILSYDPLEQCYVYAERKMKGYAYRFPRHSGEGGQWQVGF